MSESSIDIRATQFKGNNLGTGVTVYDSVQPFNVLNFKSIKGAGAISVFSGSSEITISADTSSGEANTASNVGIGSGIYHSKVGTNLRFKSILGSGSVIITDLGNELQISGGSTANAAGSLFEIQYNGSTGNTLGASSAFTFNYNSQSLTLGTRGTGTEGYRSISQGFINIASGLYSSAFGSNNQSIGNYSHAEGIGNIASGDGSHVEGCITKAYGNNSHAEGSQTCAIGLAAHSEGLRTTSIGIASHSQGYCTCAVGDYSHSAGNGGAGRYIMASGIASFNHSKNTFAQSVGHGALADYSAILGGVDHNIESGNTRAAIIGGDTIKLTGTTYVDTTAVSKLAIMSTPASGNSTQILARNPSTGIIEITSVSGGGSTAPTIVDLTDGTAITFDFNSEYDGIKRLTTTNTSITLTLTNIVEGANQLLSIIKNTSSDVTITLAGTGLSFYGYDNQDLATVPDVTLIGALGDIFEISLFARTATNIGIGIAKNGN